MSFVEVVHVIAQLSTLFSRIYINSDCNLRIIYIYRYSKCGHTLTFSCGETVCGENVVMCHLGVGMFVYLYLLYTKH